MNRNVGIEAARLTAIFLVILQHILFLGGLGNDGSSIMRFQARILEAVGQCCVDLFGLISGYVAWQCNGWKFRRFGKLWLQVWLTGWLSLSVAVFCFGATATRADLLRAAFPLIGDEYWYFTAYAFVFLLGPWINRLPRLPVAALCFVIVAGTTLFPNGVEWLPLRKGYSAAWLVMLFLFGGLIREREENLPKSPSLWFALSALMVLVTAGQRLAMSAIPSLRTLFQDQWTMMHYTSPTVTLCAAFLLLGFARMKIESVRLSKLVLLLSPCAFGVYLLHVQPVFFDQVWKGSFAFLKMVPGPLYGLSILVVTAAIFLILIMVQLLLTKSVKMVSNLRQHVMGLVGYWRRD